MKGPKEMKCGMMFASNNYHSISLIVKKWEKPSESTDGQLVKAWGSRKTK